jgi:hypothetical protein
MKLKGVKMKRTAALFLLIALPAVLFCTSPAAAGDKSRETISLFCSTYGDLGLSHGGCVAYFTNHNVVPHDTSICRDPDLRERVGARNVGQCVKALKDLKND